MREIFRNYLNSKVIFTLFVITTALFIIMVKGTIPHVRSFAHGMELPDLIPGGYSYDYLVTLFGLLGDEGRHAYLFNQIPLDMFYPGLFAITYSLILAFFMDKLRIFEWGLFYLTIIPILAGIFDYGENICLIIMLNKFPDVSKAVASISSLCTILKSTLSSITFITVIIMVLIYSIKKIIMKKMT